MFASSVGVFCVFCNCHGCNRKTWFTKFDTIFAVFFLYFFTILFYFVFVVVCVYVWCTCVCVNVATCQFLLSYWKYFHFGFCCIVAVKRWEARFNMSSQLNLHWMSKELFSLLQIFVVFFLGFLFGCCSTIPLCCMDGRNLLSLLVVVVCVSSK